MTRRTAPRLLTQLATATLIVLLAGCEVGTDADLDGGNNSVEDINPQPRRELRDGGTLRLSLDGFPQNFNILQIDGNEGGTQAVVAPTLPNTALSDAEGNLSVDHDFFTDIRLTNTHPQTVVYTINPRAVWSDGSPITWADIASEAEALSGRDHRYLTVSTGGYSRIAGVARGGDDRQAVVTFAQPYGAWLGLFDPLYPRSVTTTPEAFNTSLRQGLPVSAGPFQLTGVDRIQNRITLTRNPRWWGTRPKLNAITYTVLDRSALVPGVQNDEIDATTSPLRTLSQVKQARNASNIALRRAPDPTVTYLTFNGASGSILHDRDLRLAIAKAVDRDGIARALLFGLTGHPVPVGNHIYLPGQVGYADNSAPIRYDTAAANRELDSLGWVRHGDIRTRDGRPLVIRFATNQSQTAVETAQIIQQNLAVVGARLDIRTYPDTGFYSRAIIPGDFDLCGIAWGYSSFPLVALDQIYALSPGDPQSNFGRIGSPAINEMIQRAAAELDPVKARALANDIDKKLFDEIFSLPLFEIEGNYPVRSTLANYGAFGLAAADYTTVGFLR